MNFHEEQFPPALSFGSVGGPERRTEIVTLANGYEERNSPWAEARRRYDAGVGLRSLDDLETLIAFFEARQGQLFGFRWKDWSDYKSGRPSAGTSAGDQVIGTGDGQTVTFDLVKEYRSGIHTQSRRITKPVAGTIKVEVGGDAKHEAVDFDTDATTGQITFVTAPGDGAVITAGYEFDVPVRFDSDAIKVSVARFAAGEIPAVPVVEVRV